MSEDHNRHPVPVDSDNNPIIWGGNNAELAGVFQKLKLWQVATGHFLVLTAPACSRTA